MGLGKTIQTIAFLAHLAEEKDIWGPFLIIAPVSTLHNLLQEINRFTPAFKALPYWGTANDRRVIRKYWKPKHMYTRFASMHIIVARYSLLFLFTKKIDQSYSSDCCCKKITLSFIHN